MPTPLVKTVDDAQRPLDDLWDREDIDVATWRVIGAAGEPAFQNGWVSYDLGYRGVAFYKDPFGVVQLRGMIKNGVVGLPAFTLPDVYRPSGHVLVPTISNNAFGYVQVGSDGNVYGQYSNVYVSLEAVRFRVDG